MTWLKFTFTNCLFNSRNNRSLESIVCSNHMVKSLLCYKETTERFFYMLGDFLMLDKGQDIGQGILKQRYKQIDYASYINNN